MNPTIIRPTDRPTDRPTGTLDAWQQLSERLMVELAIDAAARRIAEEYGR